MTQKIGAPDWLQAIGTIVFVMLAVVLPFELKDPLFQIGPLAITSVEVGIYLAVVVGAVGWILKRGRRWEPAYSAIIGWAAILVVSALLASHYQAEALKFAFRVIGGCTLAIAAASFIRTPRSAALVGSGLLAGSALSAAAAQAEMRLPAVALFLAHFKTGPSMSGSYLRASGTFQYANIASMYWEATLPLAVVILSWWGCRRLACQCWWIAFAGVLLLSDAILISASRAGIAIALLSLVALFVLSKDSLPSIRSLAAFGLISSLLLTVIHMTSDGLLMLRLTTPYVSNWYHVEYEDFPKELTIEAGKPIRVPLTIRNCGELTWGAAGRQSVALSYHWLDPEGKKIWYWEGVRSLLPADVEPGATLKMEPWVVALGKPGRYILQWDMVQQDIAWFSVYRTPEAQIHVTVMPSTIGAASVENPTPADWPVLSLPRLDLWRASMRMWLRHPVLGAGPDNFRRLYGSYLGLKQFDTRVYANNMFLEMLATSGLAGLVGLTAVLISAAVAIKRAWRNAIHPEDRFLVAGIGIGLAAFCLHGLVDYFLPFTPTYGLFWILVGMAFGLAHGGNPR